METADRIVSLWKAGKGLEIVRVCRAVLIVGTWLRNDVVQPKEEIYRKKVHKVVSHGQNGRRSGHFVLHINYVEWCTGCLG